MERIRNSPIGPYVEAMTPTIEVFAMVQFSMHGRPILKPVRLVGVDAAGRAKVGGFSEFLCDMHHNRVPPTFEPSPEAKRRYQSMRPPAPPAPVEVETLEPGAPPPAPWVTEPHVPHGVILGAAIASYRDRSAHSTSDVKDVFVLQPGDDVVLTTVSGQRLTPVWDHFVVTSYFRSEMSDYDSSCVFVPLDYLQQLRTMEGRVTSIEIKLKDYAKAPEVVDYLRRVLPPQVYHVQTWEDKQGPLLAAISIEKGILNVLLFLIVGVAGFGVLAIFSMIVVEKTRDIGVLKALGASNRGVMAIFLGYGLLLGVVGAALGTAIGLGLTINLNEVEQWLSRLTGQDVFDRTVYYFDKIPTDIRPWTVALVNAGSVAIAVLFSVLPALRAALLHPVRALRYE
jgi:lipoprotein-releasing system permease protein